MLQLEDMMMTDMCPAGKMIQLDKSSSWIYYECHGTNY